MARTKTEDRSRSTGTTPGEPTTFGDRLVGALLPHAAEHLAIELMVQACPGEVFAGATRWVSRKKQLMRVRISLPQTSYSEQILSTFSEAIRQLNELLAL